MLSSVIPDFIDDLPCLVNLLLGCVDGFGQVSALLLFGSKSIDEHSQILARLSNVQEVRSWSWIHTVLSTLIQSNCWKNVLKSVKHYEVVLMNYSGITLNKYLEVKDQKEMYDHRKSVCTAKVGFRKQKYEERN